MASTNSFFFIFDRPETPSFFASVSRWSFVALASTPPAVFLFVFRPPAACASDGPFLPPAFFCQWSPTFSKLCFTAAQATWLARFSSPYSSAAESCAFANVRWAFFAERFKVLGSSDCLADPLFVVFGMTLSSRGPCSLTPTSGDDHIARESGQFSSQSAGWSSPMHPWVVRGICVLGGASVARGARPQLVVPGLVAVDLAEPVRPAVLRQPPLGVAGAQVDGVTGHVRRRLGRGDPPGRLLR